MNVEGLRNELKLKINECNELHEELKKRPIVVDKYCDLVSYENHKEREKVLADIVNNGEEKYVCARKGNGVLVLRPIHYDNEGLFMGLVVHTEETKEVGVFEIVYFGSYDLYLENNSRYFDFSNN